MYMTIPEVFGRVLPVPEFLLVLYDIHARTGNFCKVCTLMAQYAGYVLVCFLNTRVRVRVRVQPSCTYPELLQYGFCKTSVPVPATSVSSGRLPYPYPELL